MAKAKTSKKLAKSSKPTSKKAKKKKAKPFSLSDLKPLKLKKDVKLIEDDSLEKLSDPEHIKLALMECLFTNDVAAFKEILRGHIDAVSMTRLSKKSKVPRTTLYRITEPNSNPTLETLAKVLSKLVA